MSKFYSYLVFGAFECAYELQVASNGRDIKVQHLILLRTGYYYLPKLPRNTGTTTKYRNYQNYYSFCSFVDVARPEDR